MRRDLIERTQRGDREVFGHLAAQDIDRLHAIARLILRDAALAEDAVQEALIRCWRELPKPEVADETRGVAEREQLDHGFRRLSLEHRAVVVLISVGRTLHGNAGGGGESA